MRLIDADELKKKFESAHIGNVPRRIFNSRDLGYINQVIDNAPTICERYRSFCMVEPERPTDKWIIVSRNCWKCPFCQELTNEGKNFCPNCGARMKKGGAE